MTFRRNRTRIGMMILLLGALLLVSCGPKNTPVATAPPPPPPPPPAPAPTITLRANGGTTASIDRGRAVTLQWEASNAGTVRIEPGLGDVSATGTRDVNPTSSVTYTATAIGPGGRAQDTARITVNVPPPPPEAPPPPPPRRDPSMSELFDGNIQTIYFDYDKAEIRPDQMSRLQGNAAWLKQNPNVRFTIEGNCDERGSQEYNLALGDHRSNVVKEFLVQQGIASSRINIISFGEERPTCREETEACMQRNRRADFKMNP